jgi:tRNA-2-methylthio-N6-dimethylallyladenosine synthase
MKKAESDRLAVLLDSSGYQQVSSPAEADLVVLNSCVVRQHAEDRFINRLYLLESLKKIRPALRIVVTGCFVGPKGDHLKERFPYVDDFLAPGEIPCWLSGHSLDFSLPKPKVCALVPIIQGCNNFCSYCIVPYRRGREKSRPLEDIILEVRRLVAGDTKEVTILGQNIGSYGHDLPGSPDLATLLEKLNQIEGLARIRFLTNHPRDMSPRLLRSMSGLEKVCEEISLPVQSGDDDILKSMRRDYTVDYYRAVISELRCLIPGVAISTDVIVGFPGESEAAFKGTLQLLRDIEFDTVHVAAYSPRPGTIASREYKDDVSPDEKKKRLRAVEGLEREVATRKNAELLGTEVEILIEDNIDGHWMGRTRTGKKVFFEGQGDLLGSMVICRIDKTSPWSLHGILISSK